MFKFWRKRAKSTQQTTRKINPRRALLRAERMEDRDVPSMLIYNDTFNWNGVASVTETVTYDDPSHPGQYLWNFHVTNESFGSGIGSFLVPTEDVAAVPVSNLGSSVGWTGSVGTLMNDPNLVSWQTNGPTIGVTGSADFWFTTIPVGLALTNGIVSNLGLNPTPGGLLVVPTAASVPPQPFPYPAFLVTNASDKMAPNEGESSLREAIEYINNHALPLRQREIRFASGITGQTIALGSGGAAGALDLQEDVWINGTGRNITITRGAFFVGGRLISVDEDVTSVVDGLTFTGGNIAGGAIESEGELTVRNCDFHDNTADRGAAIEALAGTLTVLNCEIYDNHAINEGQGRGGGIDIYDSVTSATITDTWIHDNTSDDKGGGIYIVGGDPEQNINTSVTLNNVWIFHNQAATDGGGVMVSTDAVPQLVLTGNSMIEDNSAQRGGGVYLGVGTVVFSGVTFINNDASQGDGLFIQGGASTSGTNVTWINNEAYYDD